jgi:hypothetical protein
MTPQPDAPAAPAKVFCIGLNKTGTTSIGAALEGLGYRMGHQHHGENLLPFWLRRNFAPIVQFARSADAFQDIPFSLPFTYMALHAAFPAAHFVLTRRDSTAQWLASVLDFAALGLARLPTAEEMRAERYAYPGFLHDAQIGTVPGTSDADPWNRQALCDFYESHNAMVQAYFRGSDRLLVLNPAQPDAYDRLCRFLGRAPAAAGMPHLNATPRD